MKQQRNKTAVKSMPILWQLARELSVLTQDAVKCYSPEQLAELLGTITESTLNKWRDEGCGPAYFKTGEGGGGHVLYPHGDVMEWIQGQKSLPPLRDICRPARRRA